MSINLTKSDKDWLSSYYNTKENSVLLNGTEFDGLRLENLLRGDGSGHQFGGRDPFKLTLDYINLYCTPFIIFTGITGNLVTTLVLLKTFLKVKPWSLFLAFRALVDTGYLLCLFLIWLPRINILIFHSTGVCQTVRYLNYIFSFLSAWSVVGLTMERYVTLYYPMLSEKYLTRKGAAVVLLMKSLLALVLYNFAVWTNEAVSIGGAPICMPVPEYYHLLTNLNIIDKTIAFVLPVIIIVALNACIIFKIWLYSKLFNKCSKPDQNSTKSIARLRNSSSIFQASLSKSGRIHFTFYKSSKGAEGCFCDICANQRIDPSRKKPKDGFQRYTARRNISRFQSSRLLISLCLLFVITASPHQIFQFKTLLTTFSSDGFRESKLYLNIQELCHLVSFLNFSMVFIVLIFSSDSFRTALFRLMVRCKHGRKKIKVLNDSG